MLFSYKRRVFGYECDVYGHLNNANYQHIYEEARSDLLDKIGISLKYLKDNEVFIYLRRIEVEYLKGVPFGEEISVESKIISLSRIKSVWLQEIHSQDRGIMNRAVVEAVFTKNGKPHRLPSDIEAKFRLYVVDKPDS